MTKANNRAHLSYKNLNEIFGSEVRISQALSSMKRKSDQLEQLHISIKLDRDRLLEQINRLETVFEIIGKGARNTTYDTVQKLVKDGKEVMQQFADSAEDAGFMVAACAAEEYRISVYSTLKTWIEQYELDKAARHVKTNLETANVSAKIKARVA